MVIMSSDLSQFVKGVFHMNETLTFQQLIDYCQFDYVPETLAEKYEAHSRIFTEQLIERDFLQQLLSTYDLPTHIFDEIEKAIQAIEKDSILFSFTLFLVEVLGHARNNCDSEFYTNMTPGCLQAYADYYSFIVLLACIKPSMERLEQRGVPKHFYEGIPHQPLKLQLEKLIKNNDAKVFDFPWVLNFYSCSIFLLDRFLFIPHKFEDSLKIYRNSETNNILAFHDADKHFRRDGQPDGINDVYDTKLGFTTVWYEDTETLSANIINPLGFVQSELVTIKKNEWNLALDKGDTLLALHVPSGSGYNVERLQKSMALAIQFYEQYYPELNIKGFWSSSWLYDSRLSLVLNEESNIVQVQRQFFTYPTGENDSMLRYELFGRRDADPINENLELKTSLQKEAVNYMKTGGRFNTLSMVVLKEEVNTIGAMPYISQEDIQHFKSIVDVHL